MQSTAAACLVASFAARSLLLLAGKVIADALQIRHAGSRQQVGEGQRGAAAAQLDGHLFEEVQVGRAEALHGGNQAYLCFISTAVD